MKSYHYHSYSLYIRLAQEGIWNEICSIIQGWRRSLGLESTDLVNITANCTKDSTKIQFVLHSLNGDFSISGVDSKEVDLFNLLSVPKSWNIDLMQHSMFHWMIDGAPYICTKIFLNAFKVNQNAENLSVEYK